MRRSILHPSATALLWTLALGCSSASEGGDAAEGSETGATEGEGEPTSPVDPTVTPPSGEPTDGGSDDDSSDSSDSGEPTGPDPYGGEWCGTTSTGPLALGIISENVRFARSNGAPLAFAGWGTATYAIQIAIYDIVAGSWGEPVTLEAVGYSPHGAVDAAGNAVVAYIVGERFVVQHYDAAAATWTRVELESTFANPQLVELMMSETGHAVLIVSENYDVPTAWFLDAATGQWSEPTTYDTLYGTIAAAQDPETGDVVLALAPPTGGLSLQHRDAATGAVTATDVDVEGFPSLPAAIGDGEFMVLSDGSGFETSGPVHAHHFDGAEWREPELIGSGYELLSVTVTGTPDGRAVASWNDTLWGTYARTFDRDAGWGETLTAAPTDPTGFGGWADHRVAMDGEGFTIVWSSFGAGPGIRTVGRRYEDGMLAAPSELDPGQPLSYSRIESLEPLGVNRLRAFWGRDSGGGTEQYLYACHTPVSGWSAATPIPDALVWSVEPYPGGDVLVMAGDATGNTRVEYFAAQ